MHHGSCIILRSRTAACMHKSCHLWYMLQSLHPREEAPVP